MRKGIDQLIVGLDIGSSMIRLAVGQLVSRGDSDLPPELQILGAAENTSQGMHRGVINSIEDVVSAVSASLEKAERMVGVPIDSVWLGISGLHVISQNSKGVVAVSKADSEITEEDIARAVDASRTIATPLNYEVLHVLPKTFSIDGQSGIKDPVGMTGIRLEVDTQIILGSSTQIKNVTKAVYRTGLEIDDLVLSILAAAEAVATPRQKELGVSIVNIGASTTSIVIFEEGDVVHTAVLPIGSEHITNDLAIGLRTSIDVAEAVKVSYGDCSAEGGNKREEIDLYELGSPEHELIKKQYVAEIIQARVEEIFKKINQELHRADRSGLLPAGIIFTGGGSKLAGLVECAKKNLRLPATVGYPLDILSITEKVNDLGFATAVGLVKWGSVMHSSGGGAGAAKGNIFKNFKKVGQVSSQLKKWMKTLIP
jgi:cell division protein FtsA